MSELLFNDAKFGTWKETHNFDNCKLNRKEYGEFICDYITGEKDGFVLNLNGAWGAGKTEFLKRIYTHLITQRHPVIYINAWESDLSKEPLAVVISELLGQLSRLVKGIEKETSVLNTKIHIEKIMKGLTIGLAGLASIATTGTPTIGATVVSTMLESEPTKYIDTIVNEYSEQMDAIKAIRDSLSELAKILNETYFANIPVVILLDELDRCRPTYAIEMLEVIKHFFKTDNMVFLVATDTEQLSHSIKAVYGQGFESKDYLKRFFDRKATLPEPDIERYLNAYTIDYSKYSKLNLFPLMERQSIEVSVNKSVALLSKAYNLHIRDIDQLMNKFESCLRLASNASKQQYINILALLVGLIEHDKSEKTYDERTNFNSPEILINNANYKISNDLTLQKYIKISMDSITATETNNTDRIGQTFTKISFINIRDLRASITYEHSDIYQNFIEGSAKNIQFSSEDNKKNCKYWVWEDMKRAIELAGTLE
ncbi:KAP family P-loop NTPase fold protein [Psychromonas sp. L1A2]|uniref:KAP family P-loop NTPase fold protein n=1 Tax=Psychromonas sp. L1A2 TaxID=2686356 RepID=UPI0013598104|nr:P-loop NTPase fold protein [Psychromonas sp. L1A2]